MQLKPHPLGASGWLMDRNRLRINQKALTSIKCKSSHLRFCVLVCIFMCCPASDQVWPMFQVSPTQTCHYHISVTAVPKISHQPSIYLFTVGPVGVLTSDEKGKYRLIVHYRLGSEWLILNIQVFMYYTIWYGSFKWASQMWQVRFPTPAAC